MIFAIIPREPDPAGFRLFTSYSAMEQVMLGTALVRKSNGQSYAWCFGVAYDGVDELLPVWMYSIQDSGILSREYVTSLPSKS